MTDDKKHTSSFQNILNDVNSAVADDRAAKAKKSKKAVAVTVSCVVIATILVCYGIYKFFQERQFRDGLLETAVSITANYGVDDLTIYSVKHHGSTERVVFQSALFAELPDKDKLEVFREFYNVTGTYSDILNCWEKGTVVIISSGKRYTARIHEYNGNYQRYLYADGNEILGSEYTKPSSSSSNSSSSNGEAKACSGGSVGCRSGFHPCHEMSNGYCNMCCKG